MRIPLYAAILLCLPTVLLVWWAATRKMDFLTPPSAAALCKIREEALASLPASRPEDNAISIKVPIPEENITIQDTTAQVSPTALDDITSPPVLDTYSDRAPEGSAKLFALAAALERAGAFQRAFLEYERILDLSESNREQIQSAVSSIRRLKPTLPNWNNDPESAAQAVIHIGTGEKFAQVLPDIIAEVIHEMNTSSSGIVRFTHELHIGRMIQNTDSPTPVALWIAGPGEDAPSTDVLSFTTDDQKKLRNDLLKNYFNLVRGHLSKTTSYNPAPEVLDDPSAAMGSHITRLLWKEFGRSLNPKP